VVAFGDSGNDVEMLRQSGFSFAMANARPHIKAVARFEAPHNNDEGVLDVIEKVLNGKRRLIDLPPCRAHREKSYGCSAFPTRLSFRNTTISPTHSTPLARLNRLNSPLPPIA
jgi:hypothetical protein